MKRKYYPWTKYACHVCGCEDAMVSRDEPAMIEDGELLCEACEIHRLYEDDSHKVAFAIAFVESIIRQTRRPWKPVRC